MAGEPFFHGMPAERDTYGGGLYNGVSGGSGYGDSRPYDPYLDTTKERPMIGRGERLASSSTSSSSMRDSDLGSFTPREKDRRKEREQGRVSREDKEMMRLRRDKDPLASSSLSSLSSSSSSSSSALPLQDDTGRQDTRDKNESREDSTSRDPRKAALGPSGGGDESLRNSTDLALRADRVQAAEGSSAYESTKPLSVSGSALSRDRSQLRPRREVESASKRSTSPREARENVEHRKRRDSSSARESKSAYCMHLQCYSLLFLSLTLFSF
jgi:hypothetical protein